MDTISDQYIPEPSDMTSQDHASSSTVSLIALAESLEDDPVFLERVDSVVAMAALSDVPRPGIVGIAECVRWLISRWGLSQTAYYLRSCAEDR